MLVPAGPVVGLGGGGMCSSLRNLFSQFWRPEVHNQDVGGAALLLKPAGENPSLSPVWPLAVLGVLGL